MKEVAFFAGAIGALGGAIAVIALRNAFYSVLALTIANLMRRQADQAGLHLSVRDLLATLAGIQETVLLHHDGGPGRPRAQRILTDMNDTQRSLYDLFGLDRYAPTR